MAASLPGSTPAQNAANPSAGHAVIFDALSGPKGSPFGGRTLAWDADGHPEYTPDASNLSTGALSTGIGFGSPPIIGLTAPASIKEAGFTDDYIPGQTAPAGTAYGNSAIMFIGGGRCDPPAEGPGSDGIAAPNPYTAGYAVCMAGNGGSRDGGAGPAFTGFPIKTVTASGTVANGSAVETGWLNRSGVSITAGQSVFGSSTSVVAAPSLLVEPEPEPEPEPIGE